MQSLETFPQNKVHWFNSNNFVQDTKLSTKSSYILFKTQGKAYYDENFENFKWELCQAKSLNKWLVARHTKDNHKEEKSNDQPHTEDKTKNDVKE